jgi:deoxyhypusine synthase
MHKFGISPLFFTLPMALFSVFGMSHPAFSQIPDSIAVEYQKRILMSRIDDVYIPKDIREALEELDKKTSEESRNKVRELPEAEVLALMEFRLGLWIKKNWSFVLGSRLLHSIKEYGPQSPDEAVEFILIAWHRHLNGSDLNLEQLGSDIHKRRIAAFEKRKAEAKVIHSEILPLESKPGEEPSKKTRN